MIRDANTKAAVRLSSRTAWQFSSPTLTPISHQFFFASSFSLHPHLSLSVAFCCFSLYFSPSFPTHYLLLKNGLPSQMFSSCFFKCPTDSHLVKLISLSHTHPVTSIKQYKNTSLHIKLGCWQVVHNISKVNAHSIEEYASLVLYGLILLLEIFKTELILSTLHLFNLQQWIYVL